MMNQLSNFLYLIDQNHRELYSVIFQRKGNDTKILCSLEKKIQLKTIDYKVKFWLQFVFLTSVSWRYTKLHAAVIFCVIKKLLKPNNNYIKQYQRLYSHCNLFRLPLPLNRCMMTNATQWLIYNANICFSTIHEAIYLFALRLTFYKGKSTRIPDRIKEVNQ